MKIFSFQFGFFTVFAFFIFIKTKTKFLFEEILFYFEQKIFNQKQLQIFGFDDSSNYTSNWTLVEM